MSWASIKNVKDIVKDGAVDPLREIIDGLDYFPGVQVGQTVYAADGHEEPLPLIAGSNMTITPTEDGIRFDSTASGTTIRLDDVSGALVTLSGTTASIAWTDPENIVMDGITLAAWAGTKVIRKAGSAPTDETDGTVIVDSIIKNQYSSNAYTDTGLSYDTTYYYRFFPYTQDAIYTKGTSCNVTPVRQTISTIPSQSGSIEYDGALKTASFNGYDSDKMTVTGNTGTDAGTYTAVFTPKDGYMWSDSTTAGKEVSWVIDKQPVSIPVLDSSVTITYDGTEKNAITLGAITGYDSAIMTVSGNTRTNAGSQTATFSLTDSNNYEWDGNDPTVTWSIGKASFTATVSIPGYTYAGTKSTPVVSNNPGNGAVTFYGRATAAGESTAWGSVTNTTYDAGTRYCYAVIAETDNYLGYTTENTSFTISKASFVASVSISGYSYAGTKSTPTVDNNPGNGSVTYYGRETASGAATAWESVTATTYDAGTRYCYAVIAETTNYLGYTTENTAFVIAKGTFSTSVSISGYTYAGTKSSPSVANNPGSGAVTFYGRETASGTATEWDNVTATTYDAGTRYCCAVIAETANYEQVTTENTSFVIAKAAGAATLSESSVTLDSDNTSATVTVSGATGTVTVQGSSDTSVATATISGSTVTINSVNETSGTAVITLAVAEATNYSAATKTIDVSCEFSQIYGAEWDGTSTTAWSRTDAAAGFTDPSPAVNNGNGSSPFDTISPWKDLKRVEDATAGTLVEIPKYYYKWTRSGSKMKLQISSSPFDGALVSPAHADRGDGVGERDVVYVGAYHCASTYKSTTGVQPKTNATRASFRTSIHNLGSNIWQYDYAMFWTIMMLYLVEYADWNSQAKIGYGCSPSGSMANMGGTDGMTYHTGTSAANRTTYGWTRYRWIEGLWDNVYDWCDGIYFSSANVYCIKNPASFSDSSGGTLVGTRATSGGYISGWTDPTASGFEYALYPNAVAGSDSTYICDYCSYNASGVVLRVGGYYNQSQNRGAFYLYGSDAASSSSSYFGSRLQKLPG